MSEITNMASVLLIENSAIAFGLASKKRADEHVANGVPVPWVSARMLVSAGEFVDRATTEGEQE